jgi:hypothetical protein
VGERERRVCGGATHRSRRCLRCCRCRSLVRRLCFASSIALLWFELYMGFFSVRCQCRSVANDCIVALESSSFIDGMCFTIGFYLFFKKNSFNRCQRTFVYVFKQTAACSALVRFVTVNVVPRFSYMLIVFLSHLCLCAKWSRGGSDSTRSMFASGSGLSLFIAATSNQTAKTPSIQDESNAQCDELRRVLNGFVRDSIATSQQLAQLATLALFPVARVLWSPFRPSYVLLSIDQLSCDYFGLTFFEIQRRIDEQRRSRASAATGSRYIRFGMYLHPSIRHALFRP